MAKPKDKSAKQSESTPGKKTERKHEPKSVGQHAREWADALVIAFVLAMFIRTFVAELYKIPTGSMIPTLIGGQISEFDVDADGDQDYVAIYPTAPRYQAFLKQDDGGYSKPMPVIQDAPAIQQIRRNAKIENHLVLVNKFAYLFSLPERGEIVIFKVPPGIYERDKPIYIKRLVGLPGERLEIVNHALHVDGREVVEPPVFERIQYWPPIRNEVVPEDEVYVFGDNSRNSRDSRDWGGVAVDNLRGRAVLRPWPIKKIKFF